MIGYEGLVQMPPRRKLAADEIASLTAWVKQGAPWPETRAGLSVRKPAPASPSRSSITAKDRDFWSFRPVQEAPPPAVGDAGWPRSGMDRFVLAKLESTGLRPAPPADRRTLLRRLTFDLIGLPPSPEEVDDFLRRRTPGAFERVVDRLLASPHYGERWGRYWLDVARYGEDQAHSFQPRLYPYGYRYRDWVVRALNSDMPYDRFIVEQIAGDLIEGPGRLGSPARRWGSSPAGRSITEMPSSTTSTPIGSTRSCRGFLGLTVACARCHDHKYDPIPTTDYYALEGVFASTEYVEGPPCPREGSTPTRPPSPRSRPRIRRSTRS